MKLAVQTAVAVVCVLSLTACGGGGSDPISTEPPTGLHGGEAWTMQKATVTKDGDTLAVRLFAEEVPDCDAFPPQDSTTGYIMWNMPAEAGPRSLKFDLFDLDDPATQTVTFVTPPSDNFIATRGFIDVKSLSETEATIALRISTYEEEGFTVEGTFTATLCE